MDSVDSGSATAPCSSIATAAAATAARKFVTAFVAANVRYGIDAGGAMLAVSANVPLTIAAAVTGAAVSGCAGFGLGSEMATSLLRDTYANNRCVQLAAAVNGALVFGVVGAAPPVIAYLLNPLALNTVAVRTLANGASSIVRELGENACNGLGPRIVWNGMPTIKGLTLSTAAYAVMLAVGGAVKPLLPEWVDATISSAVIAGGEGGSGAVIRGVVYPNETSIVAGSGRLTRPRPVEVLHAAGMRTVFGMGVQAQNLVLDQFEKSENPHVEGMARRLVAVINGYRTWFSAQAQDGFSKVIHKGSFDLGAGGLRDKELQYSADVEVMRRHGDWSSNSTRNGLRLRRVTRNTVDDLR
ncbi:hypothetical protein ACVBEF_03665 [Glaciimonas sp. GG7]